MNKAYMHKACMKLSQLDLVMYLNPGFLINPLSIPFLPAINQLTPSTSRAIDTLR